LGGGAIIICMYVLDVCSLKAEGYIIYKPFWGAMIDFEGD